MSTTQIKRTVVIEIRDADQGSEVTVNINFDPPIDNTEFDTAQVSPATALASHLLKRMNELMK
jgi:hypothetical protein